MSVADRRLITTLGPLAEDQVGWMLAHEHVFANFAADDDYGAQAKAVVPRVVLALERARAAGFTVLADATAVGGARRPDIIMAVSQAARMPVLVATGLFKEPAKREWAARHDEDALRDWLVRELTEGCAEGGPRAGWIKLSAADGGVLPHEAQILRAAAAASRATGALVGSHTVGAALAHQQLDLFEAAGGDPARFLWIHTQTEPAFDEHVRFARRGAWIEYDAIDNGSVSDATYAAWVVGLLDAGLGDQVLLSHDRVGYNPALADGGPIWNYAYLGETFVPLLRTRGVGPAALDRLLLHNPFRAYAR